MMELIYTSSSKGVDRGSQGYCTVACSDSIPPKLKMNLENMSDYPWVFPPHHKDFNNNPVNFSFKKLKAGEEWLRVISRIGLNGLDYSGRPNKIAHFICLNDDDLDECHELSPAHIVSGQNTFVESWEEGSQFLEKDLCDLSLDPVTSTSYWEEVTGDAGWASHFIEQYQDSMESQINVVYDSHIDPLRLIMEAMSLLSAEEQWETTFSTYFNGTSLNSTCNWRFILRGSKYQEGLKSNKNVIDFNDFQGQAPVTDLSMDELSIEDHDSVTNIPETTFKVSNRTGSNSVVGENRKSSGQRRGILLLAVIIVSLVAVLLLKPAGKQSQDGVSDVQEEEVFYPYKVEQESIPEGHELEEFGDVLIRIDTDKFLTELKANKKMSLDVFKTKPDKISIKLVSTKQYKIIDNVISKLFLEKIDGEFIQNKIPLIKVRISKELVVESIIDIDEDFIEEFKNNIKKMKVNRVIFEFISH
jgi:hypothetical protein